MPSGPGPLGIGAENPEEILKAASNVARREADLEFYNRISAAGFTGAEYDLLIIDLIAYAFPVLMSWLGRGTIFSYTAGRKRPVVHDERDQELLVRDRDGRQGLAYEIIAEALKLFREKGLIGQGWTFEGGAALTTFFVGACVAVFPTIWRRWRKEQQRHHVVVDHVEKPIEIDTAARKALDARICDDPADVTVALKLVRAELDAMPAKLRPAAELIVLHGCSIVEAAEQLGTSAGAIEQRLRRYRNKRLGADVKTKGDT